MVRLSLSFFSQSQRFGPQDTTVSFSLSFSYVVYSIYVPVPVQFAFVYLHCDRSVCVCASFRFLVFYWNTQNWIWARSCIRKYSPSPSVDMWAVMSFQFSGEKLVNHTRFGSKNLREGVILPTNRKCKVYNAVIRCLFFPFLRRFLHALSFKCWVRMHGVFSWRGNTVISIGAPRYTLPDCIQSRHHLFFLVCPVHELSVRCSSWCWSIYLFIYF